MIYYLVIYNANGHGDNRSRDLVVVSLTSCSTGAVSCWTWSLIFGYAYSVTYLSVASRSVNSSASLFSKYWHWTWQCVLLVLLLPLGGGRVTVSVTVGRWPFYSRTVSVVSVGWWLTSYYLVMLLLPVSVTLFKCFTFTFSQLTWLESFILFNTFLSHCYYELSQWLKQCPLIILR